MGIQKKIQIIKSIQNALNALIRDPKLKDPDNDKIWTRKIKSSLCVVGYKLGYYACANKVNFKFANNGKNIADRGEWLYDVTWIKYEENRNDNTDIKEIPFVAECEWGGNQKVRGDFQKLLQARAGIRLFICHGLTKKVPIMSPNNSPK